MITIPQAIAFKEALNAIKITNKDIGAYYNMTPTTASKNKFKESLEDSLRLKILFGELTNKIVYKEWGESKKARSLPVEQGTFLKVNALTNKKESIEFDELNLDDKEIELIRKAGVLWLKEN